MWYAATAVADDADALPVDVETAKRRLRVDFQGDDALLADLLRESAATVASYCGLSLMPQTLTAHCDAFADLARLPDGPVLPDGIERLAYTDPSGLVVDLPPEAYELRPDGLHGSIVPVASWPVAKSGTRIVLQYKVGFSVVPFEIHAAILLRLEALYKGDDNPPPTGEFGAFDALLVNYRR